MASTAKDMAETISTHALLNRNVLLQPVSDTHPTGRDLREDASATAPYHRLRDIRSAARNNERAAQTDGETDYISGKDWLALIDDVPDILIKESKDLELVAWLIEALTRNHGFRGLAEGYQLAADLIEAYGDALYPLPDEDGVSTQLAALTGLNGHGSDGALIAPVKSIRITQGDHPACTWECEQAFATDRISDPAKREARNQRGYLSKTEIDQAVAETSAEFFQDLIADVELAVAAFDRYQTVVDAYASDDPQPSARIRDTLQKVMQTLRYIAADHLAGAAVNEELNEEATDADGEAAANGVSPREAARIDDRKTALKQLREIAQFFRRTEPHSPISYAIEQAVYWSDLTLPDLIGELIPDESARQKYQKLAGIRSSKE